MKADKRAIILMGHGSRVPGAGKNMEDVAGRLKQRGVSDIVEVCYMERLGPRFNVALEACVKQGATTVILIPYFLHMGLHTRVDIPTMMKKAAQAYPQVSVIFGKNLGFDDLLVDLVEKRIAESEGLEDVRDLAVEERDAYPLPKEEAVFVPMSQEEAEKYKHKMHHHDH